MEQHFEDIIKEAILNKDFGSIAQLFVELNDRINELEGTVDEQQNTINELTTNIDEVEGKLTELDSQIDYVEGMIP